MVHFNRSNYRALRNMTRAIMRGDVEAAGKWTLIFDGQLMIAKRFSDLLRRRPRRKRKAAKRTAAEKPPAATKAPATPGGPVMLDPNGFSPGGAPNWTLVQKLRARAELE